VVAQGERVTITARHPDDRLDLELWVSDAHDGTERAHAALANRGNGLYDRVLSGLAPGTYCFAVSGLADGQPQRISEIVTILPDVR